MSPTSYQLLHSAIFIFSGAFARSGCKDKGVFGIAKYFSKVFIIHINSRMRDMASRMWGWMFSSPIIRLMP